MNEIVEVTQIFKALSDKNRLRILKILEIKPLCVCEITDILGLATSTVSKHLSILKAAHFIFEQKECKWVNYYLNQSTQMPYVREIAELTRNWLKNNEIVLEDQRKAALSDRMKICHKQ